MPNTREKLIELLSNIDVEMPITTAEYLIAGGVTVQKWIPVTERLPEEYTTVLVCGEDGVEPGRFYGKSGFWTYDQYEQDPIFAVTHWMPLPEPPKGE